MKSRNSIRAEKSIEDQYFESDHRAIPRNYFYISLAVSALLIAASFIYAFSFSQSQKELESSKARTISDKDLIGEQQERLSSLELVNDKLSNQLEKLQLQLEGNKASNQQIIQNLRKENEGLKKLSNSMKYEKIAVGKWVYIGLYRDGEWVVGKEISLNLTGDSMSSQLDELIGRSWKIKERYQIRENNNSNKDSHRYFSTQPNDVVIFSEYSYNPETFEVWGRIETYAQ
ncbi:hypothetical protein [Marinagarivorans cellulosilyticus]|uniref:Uncharacterized protein n=1 Tax=Marinagarivorans cellulosilyticus TaxID=2721545 RepID=A0AAN2BIU8_9GAMM|nr:hypothetical protein [Marinagarivorans cellulosilyticus]BCD96288.1 hypothetical protein MARGE09_P0488 [Marinagarivorans cellulosilyticus]